MDWNFKNGMKFRKRNMGIFNMEFWKRNFNMEWNFGSEFLEMEFKEWNGILEIKSRK